MSSATMPAAPDKENSRKTGSRLSPRTRKVLAWALGGVLVAYCGFAALVLWSMRQPPETFGKVMSKMPGPVPFLLFPFETAWTRARAGSLQVGDAAPDFSLLKLHENERVTLSELNKAQPVVLVFGSYT